MTQRQKPRYSATLEIHNIGGITQATVDLTPGVTLLAGRNATNRTSLLQALMAALGSENATLKGDADEGSVVLSIGEETYTRRLRRQDDAVVTEGDPYLDDPTLADIFAFLLESNEARRAVARSDDLREVVMRPVDTAEIEAEIEARTDERQRIDAAIEERRSLERRLPELEDERDGRRAELEERRRELAAVESEIDEIDLDVDERREEQATLERKLDELGDARERFETVQHEIESERESIEALNEERDELERERESLSDVPRGRIEEITAEVDRLRERKGDLETVVAELQTVITFNEDFRDGTLDLFNDLTEDDGDVTDQLIEDEEELVCWTCGSEVDSAQIRTMVDRLRDIRDEMMAKQNAVGEEIDELNAERDELEERIEAEERIRNRLDQIAGEIDDRESRIEELRGRERELTDEIDRLEATVEELRTDDESELIDLHTEANRLEVEIDRLDEEIDRVESEIERIEAQLEERDELEARREELQNEIEDLRTRVERLERETVETFNEHMGAVLEILDYRNIERIWIERTEREVREGRRTVSRGYFELHVVRTTDGDTVYEDTIDHLSESEREVTGLVFALAGYLAHELYEELPFILLDSIEALDPDRIAALIEYLDGFADYLVAALLEDDAASIDADYQRVTEI